MTRTRIAFDTEFLEHTTGDGTLITLISIGLVREDGGEYYAENGLYDRRIGDLRNPWLTKFVHPHLRGGDALKTPTDIAQDIFKFVGGPRAHPEFWAYFCAYDWVALCGLYGRMMSLPAEYPRWCRDIKHLMTDQRIEKAQLPKQEGVSHDALEDARHNMLVLRRIDTILAARRSG